MELLCCVCLSSGRRTRAVAEAAGAAAGLAGGRSADGGQRRDEPQRPAAFTAREMRQGLSDAFSYGPLTEFMKMHSDHISVGFGQK